MLGHQWPIQLIIGPKKRFRMNHFAALFADLFLKDHLARFVLIAFTKLVLEFLYFFQSNIKNEWKRSKRVRWPWSEVCQIAFVNGISDQFARICRIAHSLNSNLIQAEVAWWHPNQNASWTKLIVVQIELWLKRETKLAKQANKSNLILQFLSFLADDQFGLKY